MCSEERKKDRRPRGRPRAPEPSSTVSVWVSASLHDALIARATATERSVSATVRDILKRRFTN